MTSPKRPVVVRTPLLGAALKRAREAAGLTNKSRFAADLGLAPNTVYRVEAGEMAPGTPVLLRWAQRCGVGLDTMLAGVPADEQAVKGEVAA